MSDTIDTGMSRREFLQSAAAAGAGLWLSNLAMATPAAASGEELKVGIIGVGTQGRCLLNSCLKIPGVRFTAVCDIWPYNLGIATRLLKKYDMPVQSYADYTEMLDKEKGLDAVIVATPDWVHAEHTIACLKAGKHVYCEKEMSNSLDSAKEMVVTARQAKKLLQIGHQRRSNPRYAAALDLVTKKKALGRMSFVQGSWNRSTRLTLTCPEGAELDAATLRKYGYDSMERFRNWRWYRKYSGGAIADLGSHQIDIFNWFLNASPKSVYASGGLDNYEGIEWYDNVNALYEWDYKWDGQTRTVRGFYQVLSTTSHGGYAETFIGNEGSLIISEDSAKGGLRREEAAPKADWEAEMEKTMAKPAAPKDPEKKDQEKKDDVVAVGHSVPTGGRYYPPIPGPAGDPKPVHQLHLENFFDAIRKGTPLNCPGEVGYETAVTVLKVNEAVAKGARISFDPAEFKV